MQNNRLKYALTSAVASCWRSCDDIRIRIMRYRANEVWPGEGALIDRLIDWSIDRVKRTEYDNVFDKLMPDAVRMQGNRERMLDPIRPCHVFFLFQTRCEGMRAGALQFCEWPSEVITGGVDKILCRRRGVLFLFTILTVCRSRYTYSLDARRWPLPIYVLYANIAYNELRIVDTWLMV